MREKEQSNLAAPSSRRFTLPKSTILRGRINFQSLFDNSKTLSTKTVTLRYRLINSDKTELKVAFISPKKTGKAVLRNTMKRQLREAFRLNQHALSELVEQQQLHLHMALIARSSNADYHQIEKDVVTLLDDLRNRIATTTNF